MNFPSKMTQLLLMNVKGMDLIIGFALNLISV